MRMSKLVVALGAAMAVAAAPLMMATSASAASGSNSGSAVTRGAAVHAPAGVTACNQLAQPADYPATKLVDISALADFTPVDKVGKVKFAPTMEKRSVPGSWATWGSPPDTESATPNILFSGAATSITVTLPGRGTKKAAGMEVEPDPFEVHNFTAVYKKKSGSTICTINVDADGNAGAKLLAAKVKRAKTIEVSSDVDFSIAQVRYK